MSTADWYKNKIKGAYAEGICRAHFEAIGYDVEPFGIEHTSPVYASRVWMDGNIQSSASFGAFKKPFRSMPDYFASRVYMNTKKEKHRQAFLIEVKYMKSALSDGDIWQVGASRVDHKFNDFLEDMIKNQYVTVVDKDNVIKICVTDDGRKIIKCVPKIIGAYSNADLVELAKYLLVNPKQTGKFTLPYLSNLSGC